jgi:hypothetical protein
MATRKANDPELDDVASAGIPWSQVPEFVRADVEWMDGRHGSPKEILPAVGEVPVPDVLFSLPRLHDQRPRGSKAMIDAHGARSRLAACRPGAWLLSPLTGAKWAKWPDGEIGWLPAHVVLPQCLQVRSRDDIQ